ncbi:sigma-54 factor interaction domain-containing protein [Azospirillum sp. B21]|nr:sigma-54 factor interaction domain-containing protein [Azospirillum sp. B21]
MHFLCLSRPSAMPRKAALGTTNVLLNGPSGTGKEVFAQTIHSEAIHSEAIHAHGDRRDAPFIAVNCAALPRELIESELFGYVAGSFTGAQKGGRPGKFEMASGGTIFLDEITEMPLDLQAKLLRVLQEREVTRVGATRPIPIDVRVIAASNRNLKDASHRSFRREPSKEGGAADHAGRDRLRSLESASCGSARHGRENRNDTGRCLLGWRRDYQEPFP